MKYARDFAILLLVFLAITALMGAVPMLLHPHGNPALMPLSMLAGSPFHSFLIPGILLLTANCVPALVIAWHVSRRSIHSGLGIVFQGCVLLVWIVVECMMLHTVVLLHYFYAGVAALLISCGLILRQRADQPAPHHKG